MDHLVLVDIDVNEGAKIVDTLEGGGIELKVALWAVFPEYSEPRLVFAADWLDRFDPFARYMKFGEALRQFGHALDEGERAWDSSPLHLLKLSDPFIVDLRARYRGVPQPRGTRLRNAFLGGRYLEDGYIYLVR